jgi:ParB family chromosome partitioning protein
MGKFGLNDILNATSKAGEKKDYTEIWLSPYEVKPSDSNFYSQENIEELADSILAVGQQQPTVIGRVNGEYRIISGHRRNKANIFNIERGYKQYEKVRYLCKDMSEAVFELSLLVGNAFNRELTAYEKTEQAARLKSALIKARDEDGLEIPGKLRDVVADLLGESSTNIARMEQIDKNLTDEAKEQFKAGNMGITAAYETSKLSEGDQKAIAAAAAAGEDVRAKEISKRVAENVAAKAQEKAEKAAKDAEKAEIEAQQAIADAQDKQEKAEQEAENAKELKRFVNNAADALDRAKEAAQAAVSAVEKVSETDTKTGATPQNDWNKVDWVRYTLCCLLEQAEHISEDDLYSLQDMLVRTNDAGKAVEESEVVE